VVGKPPVKAPIAMSVNTSGPLQLEDASVGLGRLRGRLGHIYRLRRRIGYIYPLAGPGEGRR